VVGLVKDLSGSHLNPRVVEIFQRAVAPYPIGKAGIRDPMAHVYLGVIIVGLILTMKVVMEGIKDLSDRKLSIDNLRASTHNCKEQIAKTEEDGRAKALQVSQLQEEVKGLTEKEKDMTSEISTLRKTLDGGQRFKVDL